MSPKSVAARMLVPPDGLGKPPCAPRMAIRLAAEQNRLRDAAKTGRRMTAKIFIDGAAGTTGLEIRERLAGARRLSLIALSDAERKDAAARKRARSTPPIW